MPDTIKTILCQEGGDWPTTTPQFKLIYGTVRKVEARRKAVLGENRSLISPSSNIAKAT